VLEINLSEFDFTDLPAVCRWVEACHFQMYPRTDSRYIARRFASIDDMFAGRYPGFQAMDTAYHDLEHTLQVTACLVTQLKHRHQMEPDQVPPDAFNRSLIAVLLHDIGYLKQEGDLEGTGAKYTHIHEQRSCLHAEQYLRERGWATSEVERVQHLICCTGPRSRLSDIAFANEGDHYLGQAVRIADFIGQMSDPRYIDKLPVLYCEFEENYTYRRLPRDQWPFQNLADLINKTPHFWYQFVLPKLKTECGDAWPWLSDPQTGINSYLDAVEANIARLSEPLRHVAGG
jgi:hypothetical protein